MSPEQASSHANQVEPTSDIFSLGVVFYEMVYGRLPFQGLTLGKVLEQIKNDPVKFPRDVKIPDKLKQIIGKMLEKDPKNRFHSAQELHDALKKFIEPKGHSTTTLVLSTVTGATVAGVAGLAFGGAFNGAPNSTENIPNGGLTRTLEEPKFKDNFDSFKQVPICGDGKPKSNLFELIEGKRAEGEPSLSENVQAVQTLLSKKNPSREELLEAKSRLMIIRGKAMDALMKPNFGIADNEWQNLVKEGGSAEVNKAVATELERLVMETGYTVVVCQHNLKRMSHIPGGER